MAEARAKENTGYQDFDVEVQESEREGSSTKYILRVGVGVRPSEKEVATKWFKSCVSQTSRLVNNVKESHSKTKDPPSPTKTDIGINWNGVVDYVIQLAIKELLKSGNGELPLPDIVPPASDRAPGFFTAVVAAKGGVLKDVTTLQRHGDARATKKGSNVTLDCAVGLRELVISYNHYEANVCGCSLAGGMTMRVGSNSVSGRVTLRVRKGGECQVTLTEVKVARLSGVRVKLTGLGPLNWLASKMASWRVAKMKDVIAANVEEMVTTHVTEMLEGFRCDDFVIMMKT